MITAGGGLFVGREREMAELLAGVERAEHGRGALFLLCGEPGIGKTSLAAELDVAVRGRGWRVAWGRCVESGGAPAFWPWIQILRPGPHPDETGGTGESDPPAMLAHFFPEIRGGLIGSGGGFGSAPIETGSEQARFALFDALSSWLEQVARARSILLVLDDLHVADDPSLLMLEFVARDLHRSRILVLGTYREAEARSRPGVRDLLASIARDGSVLPLRGLGEAEVARFIERATGITPTAAFVRVAHDRTAGNPLFLDGIMRLMQAERRIEEVGSGREVVFGLPDAVRGSVLMRLDGLPPDARGVLCASSVLGRTFQRAHLEHMTGLAEEPLLDALTAALQAGLLTEGARSSGRYSFPHALVRDALYDSLSPAQRAGLHRRAGEVLESVPSHTDAPSAAEIAHHFLRASAADASKALVYSQRAATEAMDRLAYEEAASHFEVALEVADRLGAPTPQSDILIALGEARRRAGHLEPAKDAFLRAMHLGEAERRPEIVAHAALGYSGRWIEAGVVDHDTVAVLRRALALVEELTPALRSTLLGRLAIELYYGSTSRADSQSLSLDAVALARQTGDARALGYALHARHVAHWGPDQEEDRVGVGSEIAALGEQGRDAELVLWGSIWRILGFLERGDVTDLDAALQAMGQTAQSLRIPSFLWWREVFVATRAQLDGRFDDAERFAQQALELGGRIGERNAPQYFGVQTFSLAWDRGRLSELEPLVRAMVAEYPAIHAWRAALALVDAETGGRAGAALGFDGLTGDEALSIPRDVNWLLTVTVLAEACAQLEDGARAALLYSQLAAYAERIVVAGNAIACRGSVSHYLGRLAATMGRTDEAAVHLRRALGIHRRMNAAPLVARSRVELAAVLLDRGDRDAARSLLGLGGGAAEQLGMERLAQRAASLQRRATTATAAPDDGGVSGARPARAETSASVAREGELWTIAFGARVTRLKDAKGLHYLAYLLQNPGVGVHAMELQGTSLPIPYATTRSSGGGGRRIDAEARATYRKRLGEIEAELEQARGDNDLGRIDGLQYESNFLSRELAAAIGLSGQPRRASPDTERARINVTRRIAGAIQRIAAADEMLGRYLMTTVRTGTICTYLPDPLVPVRWIF